MMFVYTLKAMAFFSLCGPIYGLRGVVIAFDYPIGRGKLKCTLVWIDADSHGARRWTSSPEGSNT
jgi:hypothetical protein